MDKLHITQDDYGYWMLSLEKEDGALGLLAHQFTSPDKLIEIANELIREGKVNASIVIDPPKTGTRAMVPESPDEYTKPAPRKAGA
jgi:hypothetical protein